MSLHPPQRPPTLAVVLGYVVLTAALTWPQISQPNSVPPRHQDPLFSIWRLSWIAKSIADAPMDLFDGNIFFPEKRTLLYSDATLLQGIAAAPFIWTGMPAAAVYTGLVLASFVACGWAMFVLAFYLTGSVPGAFAAGLVFSFAPFRFDHYVHLELLSGFWTPLTLWAFHRATDGGSRRHGLLAGVFASLQLLSCIYYAVFLSTVIALAALLTLLSREHRRWERWIGLLGGGAVAVLVATAYGLPYLRTVRTIGARGFGEVVRYSPDASSFIAATPTNFVWGWTAAPWGSNEGHLFVGASALVLIAIGVTAWRAPWVRLYSVILLFAVLLALGANGPIYGAMYEWWPGFRGLRVSSRAGHIVTLCAAVLAARGLTLVLGWLRAGKGRQLALWGIPIVLLLEYATDNRDLVRLGHKTPHVYAWLAEQNDAVLLDYPVPRPHELPGHEARYQWLSTFHWRPLVNGYSGNYPRSYIRLLHELRSFPGRRAIRALRAKGVRFIVVHPGAMSPDDFLRLRRRIESSRHLTPVGLFTGVAGERLYVAELKQN